MKNRGAYLGQTKGFSSGGSSSDKQGERYYFFNKSQKQLSICTYEEARWLLCLWKLDDQRQVRIYFIFMLFSLLRVAAMVLIYANIIKKKTLILHTKILNVQFIKQVSQRYTCFTVLYKLLRHIFLISFSTIP